MLVKSVTVHFFTIIQGQKQDAAKKKQLDKKKKDDDDVSMYNMDK